MGIKFSRKSLYDFVVSDIAYQNQASFEFRYPSLFDDNSFLIDQLDFPRLDTNVGNIWIDGYAIPVHSIPKFDTEMKFVMYVKEDFLKNEYSWIFKTILSETHDIGEFYGDTNTEKPIEAYIIPLKHTYKNTRKTVDTLVLYNALIKSISLSGGFSANSQALLKFDVSLTFSYFKKVAKNGAVTSMSESLETSSTPSVLSDVVNAATVGASEAAAGLVPGGLTELAQQAGVPESVTNIATEAMTPGGLSQMASTTAGDLARQASSSVLQGLTRFI